MMWVRRRQMSWLILVQSELFFQLCRLWPFHSGTLLNDYNKHSSLLHFDDNQCHLNSRCGRSNLLRLASIALFWISIAYLTMLADCFFGLGPRIQAQRNGLFMIFASWHLLFELVKLRFACTEGCLNQADIVIWHYLVVSRVPQVIESRTHTHIEPTYLCHCPQKRSKQYEAPLCKGNPPILG